MNVRTVKAWIALSPAPTNVFQLAGCSRSIVVHREILFQAAARSSMGIGRHDNGCRIEVPLTTMWDIFGLILIELSRRSRARGIRIVYVRLETVHFRFFVILWEASPVLVQQKNGSGRHMNPLAVGCVVAL